MDTASQHPPRDSAIAPRGKWPAHRVTALTVGLTFLVVAVAMICAGAFAAIARSEGTYVDLGARDSYGTDRYGLATGSINWRDELFGWAGSVRLEVHSATKKPIFVGVGSADAINRYLSGTAYTTVAQDSTGVSRTEHDGEAPTVPAAGAAEWTAATAGTGLQTLRWRATRRPQIVFAMNTDGSRPVRLRVVSSEVTLDRMPWWLPASALAFGVVLLPIGAVMVQRAIRGRTRQHRYADTTFR